MEETHERVRKERSSTKKCLGDADDGASIFIANRRPFALVEASASCAEGLFTATFDEQDEVESTILDFYRTLNERSRIGSHEPFLCREKHSIFLRRGLKHLSDAYEALDASRPWLCYWILHSMKLLGIKTSRDEAIHISKFLECCQDKKGGGFAGGPGQFAHLAATYAGVNALTCLAIPEALQVIDRDLLLRFIKSMRLEDGSFRMHRGGEVDVRAVYCAVVVANLTNLCPDLDELFSGTAEWIVRCQTYEGGFGGYIGGEAHGGYTFCAIAALVLLKRVRLMDQKRLLKWLVNRQLSLEGGFQGRTNKLVDGCYSFWQGASFCLLGEDGIGFNSGGIAKSEGEAHWLFDQIALQEYILICCQHAAGGLIDKPGKSRDYYHTCYTLSGLSVAQHSPGGSKLLLGGKQNELKEIHPVYNLTLDVVKASESYFYNSSHGLVVSEIIDEETALSEDVPSTSTITKSQ